MKKASSAKKPAKKKAPPEKSFAWWRETSIYQVYPRSFYDSNGDGIGDIPGIIARLDYIKDLGFNAIWISPPYKSPQRDFGYDIADYRSMAPEYGTLDDALRLIKEVHKRGMRIVFDMILNHTSDEHPWFVESRSGRDNPKRDWYIWRDGRGNGPPTNWKAMVGGSGWVSDTKTGQWYFHNYLPFQPDLNFRNPAVKKAMLDIMRFWLDRGVDGFRLDIFHAIYKDEHFRDNPWCAKYLPGGDTVDAYFQEMRYTVNRPEGFDLAFEVRALLDGYKPERFAVGEVFGKEVVKNYLGKNGDGLNLLLNFDLMELKTITAGALHDVIRDFEERYPAPLVPTCGMGNHDRRRVFSRLGGNAGLAKLLALFQYTIRCVPITYNGDEIGMPDGDLPHRGAKDSQAHAYWWVPPRLARLLGVYINRDGCRTPMQWDDSAHAGFTRGTPWLPVHPDYKKANVAAERLVPCSILNIHRGLLHLRRERAALRRGSLILIEPALRDDSILAYRREYGDERLTVVMNVSGKGKSVGLPARAQRLLFTTDEQASLRGDALDLPPWSGALVE